MNRCDFKSDLDYKSYNNFKSKVYSELYNKLGNWFNRYIWLIDIRQVYKMCDIISDNIVDYTVTADKRFYKMSNSFIFDSVLFPTLALIDKNNYLHYWVKYDTNKSKTKISKLIINPHYADELTALITAVNIMAPRIVDIIKQYDNSIQIKKPRPAVKEVPKN